MQEFSGGGSDRYIVPDRDRVAKLARQGIDECCDGKLSKAERVLGLRAGQFAPQLWRILNRKHGAITRRTYLRLAQLLPKALRGELASSVLDPGAQEQLRQARAEIVAGLRGVSIARKEETALIRRIEGRTALQLAKAGLAKGLKSPELRVDQVIERLSEAVGKWMVSPTTELAIARVALAWWRIIQPLVAEDWRRLSDSELRRFVRAGVVRELTLLQLFAPLSGSGDRARAPRRAPLARAPRIPEAIRRLGLKQPTTDAGVVDATRLYREEKRKRGQA